MNKLLMAVFASVLLMGSAQAQSKRGKADTLGDRWPWSWGAECPFPWTSIGGGWDLEARGEDDEYNHNDLWLNVATDRSTGERSIYAEQYDNKGRLFAEGEMSLEGADDRLITLSMRNTSEGRIVSKLILRAYIYTVDASTAKRTPDPDSCYKKRKAFAATFCPVRGKRCLEDANYLMNRLQ